ncbi:MAG: hypothetical protein J5715_01025 [Clostridiales bacterium]|nr:hypothetical protein [Clostridiales bacterium]
MKIRKKINWGIVLFFFLVVLVAGICVFDMISYSSRKKTAEDRAKPFVTQLAALYTWPKDLPVPDPSEYERNAEKYLSSFDPAYEKVRPYLFESNVLKEEIKTDAASFMRDYLYDGAVPEQVSFTPVFDKILISKGTARIELKISSKIKLSDGKTEDRMIPCRIMMEEADGEWIVTDLYRED